MAVKQEVYTLETAQSETVKSTDRILEFDLSAELNHGVVVSNLAYAVAAETYRLYQWTGKRPASDRGAEVCEDAFVAGI